MQRNESGKEKKMKIGGTWGEGREEDKGKGKADMRHEMEEMKWHKEEQGRIHDSISRVRVGRGSNAS